MDDRVENDDYQVGYGRPPKATQFKPGQSGNGKGRRKGSRSLRATLMQVLNRKVLVMENGKKRRVTALEALLMRLHSDAIRGDPRAIKPLLQLADQYLPNEAVDGGRPRATVVILPSNGRETGEAAEVLARGEPYEFEI